MGTHRDDGRCIKEGAAQEGGKKAMSKNIGKYSKLSVMERMVYFQNSYVDVLSCM